MRRGKRVIQWRSDNCGGCRSRPGAPFTISSTQYRDNLENSVERMRHCSTQLSCIVLLPVHATHPPGRSHLHTQLLIPGRIPEVGCPSGSTPHRATSIQQQQHSAGGKYLAGFYFEAA
jgi:hypothetical protein